MKAQQPGMRWIKLTGGLWLRCAMYHSKITVRSTVLVRRSSVQSNHSVPRMGSGYGTVLWQQVWLVLYRTDVRSTPPVRRYCVLRSCSSPQVQQNQITSRHSAPDTLLNNICCDSGIRPTVCRSIYEENSSPSHTVTLELSAAAVILRLKMTSA